MVRTRNRNRNEEAPNREPAQPAAAAAPSRNTSRRTSEPADEPDRTAERELSRAASQAEVLTDRAPAVRENRQLGGVNARNAFETYGQQMSIGSITGTLIKFNKGDWVTGDDEDLEENLELVANMDQLMVGWIKWVDNRPVEQIMGAVADNYQPQPRNALGDLDQGDWEMDEQGRARDPWQFSNYIVMKEPGQAASEEFLYTFATSSKGGLGALASLCREYGKEMRTRPGEYPIVRLGSDSYQHREFGRTKVPVLEVVGWEPAAQFESRGGSAPPPPEESEPEPAPARGRSRRRAA